MKELKEIKKAFDTLNEYFSDIIELPTKKGWDFINDLTPEERVQYLNNLEKKYLKEVMSAKTFSDFIGGGFSWCGSREGFNYWSKIAQRKV